MVYWTQQKIAELDDAKLLNLRVNALAKDAHEVIAMCDHEIASRPVKASRRAPAHASGVDKQRNAEAEASAQLTAFANELKSRYDLTAATAKRLSVGTKGFRAIELLGKNGTAKIGGMKLKGVLAIDLYISYRCNNDRASLGYVLLRDRPLEDAVWIVTGTSNVIPDGKPIVDQIVGLQDIPGLFEGVSGCVETDFESAAAIFKNAISLLCEIRS